MKATREQVLAMAKEIYGFINTTEEQLANIENLVHLAQQFTLDQLRAEGPVFKDLDEGHLYQTLRFADKNPDMFDDCTEGKYCLDPSDAFGISTLYRIPETLE